MPATSPAASSKKSKPARKGSAAAAADAASDAFASKPPPRSEAASTQSAHRSGQRRLSGAFLIRLDQIEPDPEQPRKRVEETHIDELAASIRELGVLQPITVRYVEENERYRIIAGECRYRASKRAGLDEIPCWVRSPEANRVLLEQIVENWQRADLNPFDLADSLALLRDANGLNQNELARSTGKSKGEISKILAILDLPAELQAAARDFDQGMISKRHLYALCRLPIDMQPAMLRRIKADRLTARDVERAVERVHRPTAVPSPHRRQFRTSRARVLITFDDEATTDTEVIAALDEVRSQLEAEPE